MKNGLFRYLIVCVLALIVTHQSLHAAQRPNPMPRRLGQPGSIHPGGLVALTGAPMNGKAHQMPNPAIGGVPRRDTATTSAIDGSNFNRAHIGPRP
jgi:hypothetical protein